LVTVLREGKIQQIPIRDLRDETDLVKSLEVETNNIVWRPFTLFNKGVADVIEIEFENGEKVICTPTHKWYIEDENGNVCVVNASELKDHIMTI
jgi:intein/homing endonuclease